MKAVGTKEIVTERLKLRRFEAADYEDVYENYGSDPLVNKYISFAPCASVEGAKQFIDMHVEQYAANPEFYGWAITVDDMVIGSIGLFNVDADAEQCELGYSIGSKWWGKGYATEAAAAVMDYAFGEIEAHRVYASHHVDNVGSGKVLEKVGMRFEGVMRDGQKNADGSFSDLKLYASLISD